MADVDSTLTDNTPNNPPRARQKARVISTLGAVMLFSFAGSILYLHFLGPRTHGHLASHAELVGRWTHQDRDATVDLVLADNGHFERYPNFVFISNFPPAGQWVQDDRHVLTLVGGGSYFPYINGDRLELMEEVGQRTMYLFARKR